jgi:hypothetical protein
MESPAPPPPPPATAAPWWKTAAGWKGAAPWWFKHAKRAATVDYDRGVATEAERARLAQPAVPGARAVTSRRMQDFLAWRRSMLAVGTPLLLVFAVLSVIDLVKLLADATQQQQWGTHLPLIQLMQVLVTGSVVVLFFGCASALLRWTDLPVSHRRLRLGWMIGFGVPLLILLVPVGTMFEGGAGDPEAGADPQARALVQGLMSFVAGLAGFVQAVPIALSVFFALVRAGFSVLKLTPESPVGGLAVATGALLLSLFLVPLLVPLIQLTGSVLVIFGTILLLAGFLTYAKSVAVLARPRLASSLQAETRPVRRRATILVSSGLGLLLIAGFAARVFDHTLLGFGEKSLIGPLSMLTNGIEFVGRALVSAVVFSDVLAASALRTAAAARALEATPVLTALADRVQELESVGAGALRRKRVA